MTRGENVGPARYDEPIAFAYTECIQLKTRKMTCYV